VSCEQGDFLCCTEKVNLGLDNNTWGAVFEILPGAGEILKIHVAHCGRSRKASTTKKRQFSILSVTLINLSPNNPNSCPARTLWFSVPDALRVFSVQMARIMGAVNIVVVGLDEDVDVRFPVARKLAQRRWSTVRPKMLLPVARRFAAKITSGW
jgi:hypothetical protein